MAIANIPREEVEGNLMEWDDAQIKLLQDAISRGKCEGFWSELPPEPRSFFEVTNGKIKE